MTKRRKLQRAKRSPESCALVVRNAWVWQAVSFTVGPSWDGCIGAAASMRKQYHAARLNSSHIRSTLDMKKIEIDILVNLSAVIRYIELSEDADYKLLSHKVMDPSTTISNAQHYVRAPKPTLAIKQSCFYHSSIREK